MAKTLRLSEIDNVVIALSALEAGEDIATTAIPRSHKVATVDIAAGAHVRGVVCGYSRFCKVFLNEWNRLIAVVCQASCCGFSHAAGRYGSFADQVQFESTGFERPTPIWFSQSVYVNRHPYFPEHSSLTDTCILTYRILMWQRPPAVCRSRLW